MDNMKREKQKIIFPFIHLFIDFFFTIARFFVHNNNQNCTIETANEIVVLVLVVVDDECWQ